MQGVKIRQCEFNIGLHNNPYQDEYEIRDILNKSGFTLFDTTPSFISKGEWNGTDEPTFVINTSTTMSDEQIDHNVEGLCKIFRQAAIAILVDNKAGSLVYHPHYDKLRLTFDRNYFIESYNRN